MTKSHHPENPPRPNPGDRPQNAFTLMYCGTCGGERESALLSALSRAVGRSAHGVLARATCLFGGRCGAARESNADGPVVLVQRCHRVTREPRGHVVTIGPVRTTPEVNGLIRWLETSELTVNELPLPLRRAHYERVASGD
ncbi:MULTISPECIES: hypothetical protein [unclassified Dietzia]|uniref:hypothetical protein n=1 Tax=unclassified Dietzia TaxID=2617939 RepID=UPI0015F9964D|nr:MULTISPECIES: hypothetical protein [unclassified Dietzia]MBB1025509.1 hypothetical protein [Dietzia sp. DQ12-76]MBB1027294.1 hypothetical protein [Dietzia sp. DQ11-38-2]